MHTSAKGDLGLTKVISKLTEFGWSVGILISEHQHYDLLAEKKGKMIRVQVKYAPVIRGAIRIDLRCIWSNTKKCNVRNYVSSDYDVLAVYCPDFDKCYFVPTNKINVKTMVTLSLEENYKSTMLAKDFESI